jgi:predicted nucleic acid-binding protein
MPRLSTALIDPEAEIVADTSAVINLVAAGCASTIAEALPNLIVVADVVSAELEIGRRHGHRQADQLRELVDRRMVRIVSLGGVALQHFESLVIGPALVTLDDGEAATIAYAANHAAVALIDERKARRICGERFPAVRVAATIDLLIHPSVYSKLGRDGVADAIYNALQDGRMRVLPDHLEYVVALIGPERAALCPSLPRVVRSYRDRV